MNTHHKISWQIIGLCGLLLFNACSQEKNNKIIPLAEKGRINLENWNFEKDNYLSLVGEWEIYFQHELYGTESENTLSQIRTGYLKTFQQWNEVHTATGSNLPDTGYATLRLKIIKPGFNQLIIYIPKLFGSCKLLSKSVADSSMSLIFQTGVYSRDADHEKYSRTHGMNLLTFRDSTSLYLLLSSHQPFFAGGIASGCYIGTPNQLAQLRVDYHIELFFVIGIFIVLSAYHLLLYLLRYKEKVNLWFGLFCFSFGSQMFIDNGTMEEWFPDFYSWSYLSFKMVDIANNLALLFFALYIDSLFPNMRSKKITGAILIVCFICIANTLFFSSKVLDSNSRILWQYYLFIILIYELALIIRAYILSRDSIPLVLLTGTAIFIFTILNDFYYSWISFGLFVILPFGVISFVLSMALVISIINQRSKVAFELEQIQTKELRDALIKLKATQAQLIQSEKMASLGQLTAGIAHEIQNPLNFVNNFSEISNDLINHLKEAKTDEEKNTGFSDLKLYLNKINHHGRRADAIVKNMLEHSRAGTGEKKLIGINKLCEEYVALAYHGIRSKDISFMCTIEKYFDENLPEINIVPQDIGRVLLNILNNAFYAVKKKAEECNTNSENYLAIVNISTIRQSNHLTIIIKDNGSGIPDSIRQKIFEPFFTTKPTGDGTGLGLSLSYDIVKAHGGEIKVESPEETGTAFIIELPLLK